MTPRLILVEGGPRAVLKLKLPTVVGRGGKASVKVPDALISRQHCRLYEQDGELVIEDMGSTNGTLVNGYKIEEPTLLEEGCTLTIGKVMFEVQLEVSPPVPSEDAPLEVGSESEITIDSAVDGDSAKLRYSEAEGGSYIGISSTSEEAEAASSGFLLGSDIFMSDDDEKKPAADPEDSTLGSFLEGFQ